MVSKVKVPSPGSIYFDFKAKKKEENRRVVCFSRNKRSTLKGELSKRPFASFAWVWKRENTDELDMTEDKLNNNSKIVESTKVSYFNILLTVLYENVHHSEKFRTSTGVEVLNFSGFYIRNCINRVHNCEDHSLLALLYPQLFEDHTRLNNSYTF